MLGTIRRKPDKLFSLMNSEGRSVIRQLLTR